MPNLLDIRRRIKSTKNTQQITKAMKMVSASRLRRTSERAMNARPYADRIADVHASVLARMPELDSPLYNQRQGKTLILVLAGDKGLCGAFNSNIFKAVSNLLEREGQDRCAVVAIGKKAASYFRKHPADVLESYEDVFRNVTFSLAEEISRNAIQMFTEGGYGKVILLFNKFKNVLVQEVIEQQLLPLTAVAQDDLEEMPGVEHLAEPSLDAILADLAPQVVMTQVFQALLESCAAEHAARMTAMDAATNNAKEMIGKLTLEMNKARQAAITKELIEVVSGAAAL
ncbi:ATP synthase F1 subunit gamma [Sulfidibacter corallicola]|uniref:ATP synthase gamma chain n=1 Tax=Sulfidibacter corallicola TaxID=2818388 RepID=A0A8A4TYG0_SULCO|nr:ATP synthase F1 subunit gamma [Sulfidibacter corallicola]QTD54291.1 ATP synthase F1 subunit gamma [Sulfidibacter corallicola]